MEDDLADAVYDYIDTVFPEKWGSDQTRNSQQPQPRKDKLEGIRRDSGRWRTARSKLAECNQVQVGLVLLSLRQIAATYGQADAVFPAPIRRMIVRAACDSGTKRYRQWQAEIRADLREQLEADYLHADRWIDDNSSILELAGIDYGTERARFVREWLDKQFPDFSVDHAQATAIGTAAGDVHVRARAGSGKTRVMVLRSAFLQLCCEVPPEEIMLVAFNRDAVDEIKERLRSLIPEGQEIPAVLTFHALAHAIVNPEQKILVDDPDNDRNLLDQVRRVAAEVQNKNPRRFAEAMRAFYEEGCGRELEIEAPRRTLEGRWVKSHGELLIDNALFLLGVDYRYEERIPNLRRHYRPDFSIGRYHDQMPQVVIEYFGMEGYGDASYDRNLKEKQKFWSQQRSHLISLYRGDVRNRSYHDVAENLEPRLRELGIPINRKSAEDIERHLRDRSLKPLHKNISSFISVAQKRRISPESVRNRPREHRGAGRAERLFVHIATEVYERFRPRLLAGR